MQTSRMPTRQRTQFTDEQTQVLEETFKNCHYPNTETKKLLAQQLGLVENRITVWFQNRRAKQRRHARKDVDLSTATPAPVSTSTSPSFTVPIPPPKLLRQTPSTATDYQEKMCQYSVNLTNFDPKNEGFDLMESYSSPQQQQQQLQHQDTRGQDQQQYGYNCNYQNVLYDSYSNSWFYQYQQQQNQ